MATLIVHTDGTTLGAFFLNTNLAALNDEVRPVNRGGTGLSSYTIGDLLYASAATTLAKLADVAAGSYLRSGGVGAAPLWSTPTLPNSATIGDLLRASAANVYSNLAVGASTAVLGVSGGQPAWTSSPSITSLTASGLIDTGTLKVGAGATIIKVLTATAALDFPNTLTQTASDLTITVTGAVDGDAVILGVPNGSVMADSSYSAWVSAADTVTVRFLNSGLVARDPASGTFRVAVVQF